MIFDADNMLTEFQTEKLKFTYCLVDTAVQ